MPSSNSRPIRIIDAAVSEAISGAQWERVDLESRRPDIASELMLAKAAELALSPIARDQLMSLALEHGAQDFHPDYPIIDLACCAQERDLIARQILALGPHKASETEAVVEAVETRHSERLRHNLRFDLLAECLQQDAILQEAFWNHPEIPATDAIRQAMLCSIPKLRDRAEALSASTYVWPLPFGRLLNSISKRGVR
ncbi:MAG: hypothetical protein JWR59_1678 [Brevundimonas sp.]|nr:hypothetical protein [Brevundimonas sp.]